MKYLKTNLTQTSQRLKAATHLEKRSGIVHEIPMCVVWCMDCTKNLPFCDGRSWTMNVDFLAQQAMLNGYRRQDRRQQVMLNMAAAAGLPGGGDACGALECLDNLDVCVVSLTLLRRRGLGLHRLSQVRVVFWST